MFDDDDDDDGPRRAADLPPREREALRAEALRLFADGKSPAFIARKLAVEGLDVRRWLKGGR